jgi:UDP-N-acetylglucosamine 2-epimerase (non-hydrolysing)
MKIAVIVGTRPEIIKLSETINLLNEYAELVLIHTGQNYDSNLSEVFFKELGIKKPEIYLDIKNSSPGSFVGNVINSSYDILQELDPDALVVLGDTNSCMSAYSAKRLKIPIVHSEAGNRCFDLNVPEEINRRIIDHLADVNFTYTKLAKDYLSAEGLSSKYSIVVGSPMREVLNKHSIAIQKSEVLEKLGLKSQEYFLVSLHREENVDNKYTLDSVAQKLRQLDETFKLPIIFSMHPRTRQRIREFNINLHNIQNLTIMEPFGFIDYCKLQQNSKVVLSDSGTITEESSILKFRALSIRPTHERPEGEEVGALISTTFNNHNFWNCLALVLNTEPFQIKDITDYQQANFSAVIVKNIFSLVDEINSNVWKKSNVIPSQ